MRGHLSVSRHFDFTCCYHDGPHRLDYHFTSYLRYHSMPYRSGRTYRHKARTLPAYAPPHHRRYHALDVTPELAAREVMKKFAIIYRQGA